MIIDTLPVWALFVVAIGLVLLSAEIGFRMGRKVRGKTDDEREAPASSISGIILGLQAFMLAFTFGIVSDRYDHKKALVREEATAIRSAYHLADFVQEPDRTTTKALLQGYVDKLVTIGQSRDLNFALASLEDIRNTQQQLW